MLESALSQLAEAQPLTQEQAYTVFDLIMSGKVSPVRIAATLSLIQARGATVDELTAAARVMREKACHVVPPQDAVVVDTCGTGGDASGTFNISTAAAIVAAGAGRSYEMVVAKHGNRSVTSRSGSSQVIETLGVKLEVSGETLTRCMEEAGICFCYAPAHHPAMKYAAPVRAELGFRTIFNLLGPLTNPAGASRQVLGVYHPDLTQPIATVLKALGSEHAMVVYGQFTTAGDPMCHGGLDELTTTGPSQITHLQKGVIKTYTVDPVDLDLPLALSSSLQVDGPAHSAKMIRSVLEGDAGPARDIVRLNAAAALVVADLATDLPAGLEMATDAIDSGAALAALDKLVEVTQAEGQGSGEFIS